MNLIHNFKTPCMGCDNRTVGCHGTCEMYKEFRSELDGYNQCKRNFKRQEDDIRVARGFRSSDGPTYLRRRMRGRIV